MARAKFILHQPDGRLVAVYGGEATRRQLEPIVTNLDGMRGVDARISRVALDSPDAPPTLAVVMGVRHGVNGRLAVVKLKQLTRPELAYTLGVMVVVPRVCMCGYISTSANGQFVNGLEPDDQEAFWLRFYARLKKLSADDLAPEGLVPPYKSAGDAFESIARDLNTYVSQMYIRPQRDERPCTHPR